jgi:hypothetical protein
MPILAGGQRRYLYEKGLTYLFSFDVDLRDARKAAGDLVGGTWAECVTRLPDEAPGRAALREDFLAYHIHDDISVGDNDAITGQVRYTLTSVQIGEGQRVGAVEGALVIETDDGAVIDARYHGCVVLGSLGIDELWMQEPAPARGEPGFPTRARIFITPRFDSAYPKYKWLTARQCAGFGLIEIQASHPVRATVDIYAMNGSDAGEISPIRG